MSGAKHTKHYLALDIVDLQHETLGLIPCVGSDVGQPTKKRGWPHGSHNRPEVCDGVNVLDSMVSGSMVSEPKTVVEAINPQG